MKRGTTGADASPSAPAAAAHTSLQPFRHAPFAVLWSATVVSNIGSWMYAAACAWLMTTLDADPRMVSLVQVATSLPIFLFAMPAGALTDIVDRRRFLLAVEIAGTLLCAAFALLVALGRVTPASLLLLAFLIQTTSALSSPPWQAIVPQLVPRPDLPAAIAANSVGVNISRALGPALGGAVTVAAGIAAPFWINAASNLATVGALVWWRAPPRTGSGLPAERFASAIRVGVRYARHNRALRATLVRAAAFFLFASAYWALLPLVARDAIGGGPEVYGVLLGAIGAGAVGGAFALPRLKAKLGADRMMGAGALGTAVAMCLYGLAHDLYSALAASALAGVSWIAVLSSLNVSAQLALPEWVRGRGLAIYVTCFFGALTVGSAIWGEVARLGGLEAAHLIAGAGLLLAIPLTWRWKLQSGAGLDLTPSMHWPAVVGREVEDDEGPVLVTVEYRLAQEHRDEFLAALERLAHQRRRDGAYAWGVYEDTAVRGRYLETFLVESWLEHLRQHERVTNADRVLQQHVDRLLVQAPNVTHFVAAKRSLASQA